MIDQEYFEKHFQEQRKGIKGTFTVRLHLFDGSKVEVFRIQSAQPGYLLMQAYPREGTTPVPGNELDLANGPLLGLPYEAIMYVEQTKEIPKGHIGFSH